MDVISRLEEAIRVLKINEEKLTDEQKQGKYKKALNKKRQEVVDSMCAVVNEWLPCGCRLKTEQDATQFVQQYNQYLQDHTDGIRNVVMQILTHYDYEKVLEDLGVYQDYIYNTIYMPIFQSHCTNLNGKIYNDIIGMFWYPQFNCWAQKEKDGGTSFYMYPAPEQAVA